MTERCFCTDFSKDREFRMMFWNVWVESGLWKVMQTFLEIAYQKPDYFLTPASTTCYLHHKYFSCRNTCKKSILRRRKDLTDQNKQATDTVSYWAFHHSFCLLIRQNRKSHPNISNWSTILMEKFHIKAFVPHPENSAKQPIISASTN